MVMDFSDVNEGDYFQEGCLKKGKFLTKPVFKCWFYASGNWYADVEIEGEVIRGYHLYNQITEIIRVGGKTK